MVVITFGKTLLSGDGETLETNLDGLIYGKMPKTVICYDCGKRHKHSAPAPRAIRSNEERTPSNKK